MARFSAALGAWPVAGGTAFRVWAPHRSRVELVLPGRHRNAVHALPRRADGTFAAVIAGVRPGDRYWYRLDGDGPYPDPASRAQPDGVHGASQVVDAQRFRWRDRRWRGIGLRDLVIYELHVGTFTAAGTFAAAARRLPDLRRLGVTAVELMPVADFPGARNWGYDGVALFAPTRCYGAPDDLRALVDAAHRLGIAVLLDVVYNHFGPDGAYLGLFSPHYFSTQHRTPWGAALNLDGPGQRMTRAFLIENALHWLHEYHCDGLRLDATHAQFDEGPRHFLSELRDRVRRAHRPAALPHATRPLLIAEDERNLARLTLPRRRGGYALDAVWADDFHHQVRRALAGDSEGYFAHFSGSMRDLAATLQRGWFHRGQRHRSGRQRGTDPAGLTPAQFVFCLQNHDQIGNRAFGERLHHQISAPAWRAATTLLLCAPQTPLLFMGQEWAASTPFRFFTDHAPALGRLVTRGRRAEFGAFSAFADARLRARIPDPQAAATWRASRLDWSERRRAPHASVLRLHQALLALRRREPLLHCRGWRGFHAAPIGNWGIVLLRRRSGRATLTVVALRRGGRVDLCDRPDIPHASSARPWRVVLHTEAPQFAADAQPIRVERRAARPAIVFSRPGAVVLRLAGW
ncbi:MAG: malto-oligosyltrehalose trehalohydrolase [bacterium]